MKRKKSNSTQRFADGMPKKKSKWSNSNNSFLSQLQALREFTAGCIGDIQYTESDLSTCLRKCGYNVQMAAEHLITGQFKATAIDADVNSQSTEIKNLNEVSNAVLARSNLNITSRNEAKRTITPDADKKSKASSLKPNKASVKRNYKSLNGCNKTTIVIEPTKWASDKRPGFTRLLLCQRWVCGFSTTRRGSIQYNEPITIHASTRVAASFSTRVNKGGDIVRFKGSRIEGTLGSDLSSILAPLLRGVDSSDNRDKESYPLIEINCKGLMEDPRLDIGMEVPLELNVFITRPNEFFALFQENSDLNTSGGSQFWSVKKVGERTTIHAKAAFNLLQWAHYSSLPDFDSSKNEAVASTGANDDGESNEDRIDDPDENTDDVAEEGNPPEWAQDLYTSHDSASYSNMRVEETEPDMLRKKGIRLRTYQRQALSWMIYREEGANTKGNQEFQKQLELLTELAAGEKGRGESGSWSHLVDDKTGVQCTVGPVLVSDDVASKSKSLDGAKDPVVHPLWQRRFLWDKNDGNDEDHESLGQVYSFYVNELLRTASKSAPNPPKECCGGVLADSMGLVSASFQVTGIINLFQQC